MLKVKTNVIIKREGNLANYIGADADLNGVIISITNRSNPYEVKFNNGFSIISLSEEHFDVLELVRTAELDQKEKDIVELNNQRMDNGDDVITSFEFEGMAIHDPYMDASGRFDIDPLKEYGDAYIKWYNSLADLKCEFGLEYLLENANNLFESGFDQTEEQYELIETLTALSKCKSKTDMDNFFEAHFATMEELNHATVGA